MKKHEWFKPRNYKHFDAPVGEKFADVHATNPDFVRQHDWLPLIHYVKKVKRYKPVLGKTEFKPRDIMYASHRDACILAKYAKDLSVRLEEFYDEYGLRDHVIAYRKLGRSNYDFSAYAYRYCLTHAPCVVLCFDITGFFDNLNHSILKNRVARVLGFSSLPEH